MQAKALEHTKTRKKEEEEEEEGWAALIRAKRSNIDVVA